MASTAEALDSNKPDILNAWFSCLMADSPRFVQQTLTLVWTLRNLAGISEKRIIVHCLEGSDPDARQALEDMGIQTRSCAPFREGHPHCNKIGQCFTPELHAADAVILLDTDTAATGPLDGLIKGDFTARAKIVDLANPKLAVWQGILAAAGLPTAPPLAKPSFEDLPTPAFNCNGGLYVLRGKDLAEWGAEWARWADWLIERRDMLPPDKQMHIDQIAFGLAAFAAGRDIELLPLEWNYPTHDDASPKPDLDPRILHYHNRVDPSGLIAPVGLTLPDAAIARVNDVIRAGRRRRFDNRQFWNFRYSHAPDLGSGVGSRGESLEYKRGLLSREVSPQSSVLDIGCGDLEVSQVLPVRHYTGVDVSSEAVALAQKKRPDWKFHHGSLADLPLAMHDTVLCFDVLIHQPTLAAYRSLVGDLARLASGTLLVGAYDGEPEHRSEITFFYEPVSRTLDRLLGSGRTRVVGRYRDSSVIRAAMPDVPSAALDRLRRARIHNTPLGRFASVEGDLIDAQFEAHGGHTRNELAMVLSFLTPGDTVVDAGGHVGSFAIPMARRIGPAGRVLAIEPDAGNVELFYRNLNLNGMGERVVVAETAVGNGIRVRPIEVTGNTGALHFVADSSGTLNTRTIDELCAANGFTHPTLIKVDVEGMERQALESADKTIAGSRPLIYCEVVADQLIRHGTTLDDLDAFFRQRRYALYRNVGERNSNHDRFEIQRLERISEGGAFFDVLAVPAERVEDLAARSLLPRTL